jgi:hypothetical protein
VPTGPGASDDGSGVAALLETARALAIGTPLRNDVIFLFTDAEEVGLLGAALTGLALMSGGSLARGFDDTHPRPDNIFYALDADSGQAVWASGDRAPDPWTAQFLKGAEKGALVGYVPQQLINTAPALPLSPPAIELLDDTTAGGTRSLEVKSYLAAHGSGVDRLRGLGVWMLREVNQERHSPV